MGYDREDHPTTYDPTLGRAFNVDEYRNFFKSSSHFDAFGQLLKSAMEHDFRPIELNGEVIGTSVSPTMLAHLTKDNERT